jgi:hypothetical protein
MKKILFVITCLAIFASCSHNADLYEAPVPEQPENNDPIVSGDDVKENAENVLGVTLDPNQDWCTTASGEVTITVNASVSKVQLLVKVCEVTEDCPSYVSRNSLKILNEKEISNQSVVKLHYDAPKENLGFYVAFTTTDGYLLSAVRNNAASIDDVAKARTRALPSNYTIPERTFKITESIESYASQRGWNTGELLYSPSDADFAALKVSKDEDDYDAEFKALFEDIVDEVFPNGRSENNLPKVIASGYYNEYSYLKTTGTEPIIVTPLYKCDHPQEYGNEVYYSDLYYYYFKDADLIGKDQVEYIKSLPKYKAIPLSKCFAKDGDDDIVKKFGSYVLPFYGNSVPNEDTEGVVTFPAGYKIGFMVRANTTHDGGRKQGEVYCDGRLNDPINIDKNYNFSTSGLGKNDPRAAWLTINKKKMLCWESGTDKDFNDIILEFEGGFDGPTPPPPFEYNTYIFCFEDTKKGDYDMNDVVIKAVRKDATTVEYTILACGAYDELYIHNINEEVLNTEVHQLFNEQPKTFINTVKGDKTYAPYVATVTVDESFSFLDTSTQPYIEDRTTGNVVSLAQAGESPFAIMVPNDFRYPQEKVKISDAYLKFPIWAQDHNQEKDWYTKPEEDKVY